MRHLHPVCLCILMCLGCKDASDRGGTSPSSAPSVQDAQPASAKSDTHDALDAGLAAEIEKRITVARGADARARAQAILELGKAAENDPAAAALVMPVLTELLNDADPAVRYRVIRAAGEIGDSRKYRSRDLQASGHPLLAHPELLSALVEKLDDPERDVREALPRTLGKIAETNLPAAEIMVPKIVPLLDSAQPGTRAAAAEAILHIAGRMQKAWGALRSSSDAADVALAGRIAQLFPPAVPRLESMLKDEDAEVQREARSALDEIAPYSAK